MKVSEVIEFLEYVKDTEGDIKIQSITGFWIRTILPTGEHVVAPVVGNGQTVDDLIRLGAARTRGAAIMLTSNHAPYDLLEYFGCDDEDLGVIEIARADDEWIKLTEPLFPDATEMVLWYTKIGVKKIAVKYEERVVEFDLHEIIVRANKPKGVER